MRHRTAFLRFVPVSDDLRGVDVGVVRAIKVVLHRDIGRQVELAVERAGAMPARDGGRCRELVHVRGAGTGAAKAGLDAVAGGADLWEGQVDFGHDARDIETPDVADAAVVAGGKVGTDGREAVLGVVIAEGDWGGDGGDDGEGGDGKGLGEMHF